MMMIVCCYFREYDDLHYIPHDTLRFRSSSKRIERSRVSDRRTPIILGILGLSGLLMPLTTFNDVTPLRIENIQKHFGMKETLHSQTPRWKR